MSLEFLLGRWRHFVIHTHEQNDIVSSSLGFFLTGELRSFDLAIERLSDRPRYRLSGRSI